MWADIADAANLDPRCEDTLDDISRLLIHHGPRVSVEIHSHIAAGNGRAAYPIAQGRARAVKSALEARGIGPDRISTTWWSDTIARRMRWSTMEAARSEIFILLDGARFPTRGAHYDAPLPTRPAHYDEAAVVDEGEWQDLDLDLPEDEGRGLPGHAGEEWLAAPQRTAGLAPRGRTRRDDVLGRLAALLRSTQLRASESEPDSDADDWVEYRAGGGSIAIEYPRGTVGAAGEILNIDANTSSGSDSEDIDSDEARARAGGF